MSLASGRLTLAVTLDLSGSDDMHHLGANKLRPLRAQVSMRLK